MMKVLSFALFNLLLIFNHTALGGDREVGNGGYVVFCENKKPELLDYYEVRHLDWYKDINLGDSSVSFEKRFKDVVTRLDSLNPTRAKNYQEKFEYLVKELNNPNSNIWTDKVIIPTDTGRIDLGLGCDIYLAAAQGGSVIPGKSRFSFVRSIWDNLDEDTKLGLVMHEIVYWELLTQLAPHGDSKSTRYFNAMWAANLFNKFSLKTYIGELLRLRFAEADSQSTPISLISKKYCDDDSRFYKVSSPKFYDENNIQSAVFQACAPKDFIFRYSGLRIFAKSDDVHHWRGSDGTFVFEFSSNGEIINSIHIDNIKISHSDNKLVLGSDITKEYEFLSLKRFIISKRYLEVEGKFHYRDNRASFNNSNSSERIRIGRDGFPESKLEGAGTISLNNQILPINYLKYNLRSVEVKLIDETSLSLRDGTIIKIKDMLNFSWSRDDSFDLKIDLKSINEATFLEPVSYDLENSVINLIGRAEFRNGKLMFGTFDRPTEVDWRGLIIPLKGVFSRNRHVGVGDGFYGELYRSFTFTDVSKNVWTLAPGKIALSMDRDGQINSFEGELNEVHRARFHKNIVSLDKAAVIFKKGQVVSATLANDTVLDVVINGETRSIEFSKGLISLKKYWHNGCSTAETIHLDGKLSKPIKFKFSYISDSYYRGYSFKRKNVLADGDISIPIDLNSIWSFQLAKDTVLKKVGACDGKSAMIPKGSVISLDSACSRHGENLLKYCL